MHIGGDGSGTVTLRDTSHSYEARILGRNLSDDALINVNNTIQGEGYIGANLMALENQVSGVIDANVSGQQFLILIDSNAQGVTNQGTLRASNGGELLVVAGDLRQRRRDGRGPSTAARISTPTCSTLTGQESSTMETGAPSKSVLAP